MFFLGGKPLAVVHEHGREAFNAGKGSAEFMGYISQQFCAEFIELSQIFRLKGLRLHPLIVGNIIGDSQHTGFAVTFYLFVGEQERTNFARLGAKAEFSIADSPVFG